jgi:hypothetical protein
MAGRRRRIWVAAIVALAGVVALVVLATVPVRQTFAFANAAIYDPAASCSGIQFPSGVTITFHWSAANTTYFFVIGCSGSTIVYESYGTAGTGSFVAHGDVYDFGSGCATGPCYPAQVSGSYTAPLI